MLIDEKGAARVCALQSPPQHALPTRYDSAWPATKLQLRATPHAVVALPQQRALCLALSYREKVGDDPNVDVAALPGSDEQPLPQPPRFGDRYELRLLDASSWAALGQYALKADEWVMGMRAVELRDEAAPRGAPAVHRLAVGTAFQTGEDAPCQGRILLFELTQAADPDGKGEEEEGSPRWRLKLVYEAEERGPVLTLSMIGGHLLTGVGNKLVISAYKDGALSPIGFQHVGFMVSNVSVMKHVIMVADLHHGVEFLQWRHAGGTFHLLSQHTGARAASACEFMVSEGAVQLVLAEEAGRLRVFTYNKQSTESRGGKLLLPQASFHVGDHVCHLQRLQLRGGHVLLYATLDGAIGFLMPLSEAEHRRSLPPPMSRI